MNRTYTLKYPIRLTFAAAASGEERTEVIETVELRRATGKDLLIGDDYKDKPNQYALMMIQRLSGYDLHVVERIDAEDIGPLAAIALGYAESGQ